MRRRAPGPPRRRSAGPRDRSRPPHGGGLYGRCCPAKPSRWSMTRQFPEFDRDRGQVYESGAGAFTPRKGRPALAAPTATKRTDRLSLARRPGCDPGQRPNGADGTADRGRKRAVLPGAAMPHGRTPAPGARLLSDGRCADRPRRCADGAKETKRKKKKKKKKASFSARLVFDVESIYQLRRRLSLVPRRGLEPPRFYPLVPETSASTNSATWAFRVAVQRCEARMLLCSGPAVNDFVINFFIRRLPPDPAQARSAWERLASGPA